MYVVRSLTTTVVLATALAAFGQERPSSTPTPLSQLLTEASANNSQISAANHGWQAAKDVPRQVTTLPDPTVTYQNLGVGSPKPFAGYTSSDMAYVGIGASQELPYPGHCAVSDVNTGSGSRKANCGSEIALRAICTLTAFT